MEAKLQVRGTHDSHAEFVSLRDWLVREPQFRGGVCAEESPIRAGEMGAVTDVLVVALSGGGAASVLANSVSIWLQQRRSELSVKMTGPDGTDIEITSAGPAADQIAKLFRAPQS
ncbi:hypothetical protein [Nocardia sp. NPDC006630]|uniref:effector-associated constant component EACC1 n=1 Tax=Nocardia sp. NPDC006630 TaxID=3157181 RepID=UPI0033BF90E3